MWMSSTRHTRELQLSARHASLCAPLERALGRTRAALQGVELAALASARTVAHLSRELPACGIDVVASRLADGRREACRDEHVAETCDRFRRRPRVAGSDEWIE